MTAILDTSFLLALTNSKDHHHARVLSIARTLTEPLILPISVLPEICYLLASRLGHAAMRQFLQNMIASHTILETITSIDLQRTTELLEQYAA